jgi:uncharacterized protein (DUF2235 family)
MAKNIVIFSDGTGNTAIKGRGTNVFKLFEAVDLNGHRTDPALTPQLALYDDGVGTESFVPVKLFAGAFGWGLKRNVLRLYTGVVRIYDPGDRIFLFGFSRGAFTVRTVASMIATCGVLDWRLLKSTDDMIDAVERTYAVYRRAYRTLLWRILHGKSDEDVVNEAKAEMAAFKETQKAQDASIAFVGVWDTVDAVGGPFHIADVINTVIHRFKFPDHKLPETVESGVQALSIDDARAAFQPVLWEEDKRVDQVWFAGVHANVGGGYPKQGMSLEPLNWMIMKAAARGLRVLPEDRAYFWDHSDADDKLYDSRAGLGVFYRWKPRDMQKICQKQKAGATPKIHVTVLERIAHGTEGYAPGTLARQFEVVHTPTGNAGQDEVLEMRTRALHETLCKTFEAHGAQLDKVRGTVLIGQISYYVYLAFCTATVLAAAVPEGGGSRLNLWNALSHAGDLILDAFTGSWRPIIDAGKRMLSDPKLLLFLLTGFAVSGLLALYVQHRRSIAFSRFWHRIREELRTALRAGRENMLAARAAAGDPRR